MSWGSEWETSRGARMERLRASERAVVARWLRWCFALFAVIVLLTAGALETVCASAAVIPMPATVRPLSQRIELDASDFDIWKFIPCRDHTTCGKGHCWEGLCEADGHCAAYWTCV